MGKQAISFNTYDKAIAQIQVSRLPDILQKGHRFFIEASPFYYTEPTIKETIDMYLDQLNAHLFSKEEKPLGTISIQEIEFIKGFVEMHKTVQSKENIKTYIFELHSAISKKQITKDSPIAKQIIKIQQKLIHVYNDTLFTEKLRIVINRKWLRQLQNIINPSLSGLSGETTSITNPIARQKKNPSLLFAPINQQQDMDTNNTFRLNGDIGVLLGDIERFELAITIEGDQGGGKTRFTYQLADAFADIEHTVAIFSLEIGRKSDLITRMKKEYLQTGNQSKIFIADQLPEGYKSIEDATKNFDVIIIDSWNKTGLPSQDFDKLRKENPDTIFIVIFQRTTQKTIRGGTAPLFDAGINIEVIKADDTFRNNYAVTSKNRYGITGIKYNIFNKQIIGAEELIPQP